jgi:hypothetical protein
MTRTRHPRGAAAKTKAAIKREARADKAAKKTKAAPARASILAELAASPGRPPPLSFTAEQRADIDEVFAAERAGTIVCGCTRLARILKSRYDLHWAVGTIRDRLLELKAAL